MITSLILNAIGNTPLVKVEDGIFAKAEYLNPSGSIKGRMAHYIVERAEQEGLLRPGDTIVEGTSGNSGNAFSMVAAAKGYKMVVVIPNGYTHERIQISKGFGAEIRFVGDFHVGEAVEEAKRLGRQDGWFCPAQFENEWNVDENREVLGAEILKDLKGTDIQIDALVQGVGTGGTLIGVAQAMRAHHNPGLKVFAVDPAESPTLATGKIAKHGIEGVADGFVPEIFARHRHDVNDILHVYSEDAANMARELARTRGLFVGASSGMNILAARDLRRTYPEIRTVLTFLCDKGEKYLSTLYA